MENPSDPMWMTDAVRDFLQSPLYSEPLLDFIDDKCTMFKNYTGDGKPELKAIHKKFKRLVDGLVGNFLFKLRIPLPQFIQMVARQPHEVLDSIVVTSILTVDDFLLFKDMMMKRNIALQDQVPLKKKNRKTRFSAEAKPSAKVSPLKERKMVHQKDRDLMAKDPAQAIVVQPVLKVKTLDHAQLQDAVLRSMGLDEAKGQSQSKGIIKPQTQQQKVKVSPKKRPSMPPQPMTLHSIQATFPYSYDETPSNGNSRTSSRAEMVLMSKDVAVTRHKNRISFEKLEPQGIAALALDLEKVKPLLRCDAAAAGTEFPERQGEFRDTVCAREDDDEHFEGREGKGDHGEARYVTPKQASLFEDWKPVSLKLDVNDGEVQQRRRYLQQQQDRMLVQKKALREKQLRYFRRLEGGKKEPEEEERILQSQLKPELGPAAEQEQEVVSKLIYGAGTTIWRPISSGSLDTGTSHATADAAARPATCDAKKSSKEMVSAITWANQRRELMRKELAQRLREELAQKKANRRRAPCNTHSSQCLCC